MPQFQCPCAIWLFYSLFAQLSPNNAEVIFLFLDALDDKGLRKVEVSNV